MINAPTQATSQTPADLLREVARRLRAEASECDDRAKKAEERARTDRVYGQAASEQAERLETAAKLLDTPSPAVAR